MGRRRNADDPEHDPHGVKDARDGKVFCVCGWVASARSIAIAWDVYYEHWSASQITVRT